MPLLLQPFDLVGEGHEGAPSVWLGQDYHSYVPQHRIGAGDASIAGVDSHPVQMPALVLTYLFAYALELGEADGIQRRNRT